MYGTPVLGANIGGIPELIQIGNCRTGSNQKRLLLKRRKRMAFQLQTAKRSAAKLKLAVAGPSGSGKTMSSLLLTDPKTLQAIAGHASCDITMNRYVHKRDDKVKESRQKLAGLFD